MVFQWVVWSVLLFGFGGVLVAAIISKIISNRTARFPSRAILIFYAFILFCIVYVSLTNIPK